MNIDLGMAMAVPFPLFSNPSLTRPTRSKAPPGLALDIDADIQAKLNKEMEYLSPEQYSGGLTDLSDLRDSLGLHGGLDIIADTARIQEKHWRELQYYARKVRTRQDSGVSLGETSEYDACNAEGNPEGNPEVNAELITPNLVQSPKLQADSEKHKNVFKSAADILNRLATNLDTDELKVVTQTSLDQFYSTLRELKSTVSVSNKEVLISPICSEFSDKIHIDDVVDESGAEFRHLFDNVCEDTPYQAIFDDLSSRSSLLGRVAPFVFARGRYSFMSTIVSYLKQTIGGYAGFMERVARHLIPNQLEALVWPILSYLIVVIFVAIISKQFIQNNWEHIKEDATALLDLLRNN